MQTSTHVPGQVLSQEARGPQQNGNVPNGTRLPWPRWQSEAHDIGLRRNIVDNINWRLLLRLCRYRGLVIFLKRSKAPLIDRSISKNIAVQRRFRRKGDCFSPRLSMKSSVYSRMKLFKSRKPHVSRELQLKLPDFVKRLEEGLYKNAASKDEYADLETLEQRLRSVARQMVAQSAHSVSSSAPMSNMTPTPGVASNLIPTAGNGSNMMQTSGSVVSMMHTPGTTGNLLYSEDGIAVGLRNMRLTPGSNNV